MSRVRANGNHGFVGLGGVPTLVSEHDEYEADHPLVQAFPQMFDAVPDPAPEPVKRPILSRKAKAEDG